MLGSVGNSVEGILLVDFSRCAISDLSIPLLASASVAVSEICIGSDTCVV